MEQYIDKATVVAEIERRKKELIELSNDFVNQWACASLDNILSFLDTIEVQEVKDESVSEDLGKAAIDAADEDMQGRQIMEESTENILLYSRIFRRGSRLALSGKNK